MLNFLFVNKLQPIFAQQLIAEFDGDALFSFFNSNVYLTKDNTPFRLTSVAHLRGFLFYKSLAL